MDRRKRRSGGRPRSAPATVQRRPVSRTAVARRRALAARRRRALVRRRRRILLISVLAALLLCVGVAVGIGSLVRQTPQGEAEPREETYTVNEACETYRPTVTKMAKTYGMGDYVDLIMAVMMQESSGGLVDVMQSSEGKFNTKYPQEPNGITDTEYSIECGIQELKDNLEQAGCTGPEDMDKIKIALQAYNFGSGYLGYLKEKGRASGRRRMPRLLPSMPARARSALRMIRTGRRQASGIMGISTRNMCCATMRVRRRKKIEKIGFLL
ncbi:MAG: lysozyme family protein [Blautia sp.]